VTAGELLVDMWQ